MIGVHLGSSILLYVESFGDRLLLMRTHEDLSSDMELLVYVFYGFVVIFYLAECHGIYEVDYITSFLEGVVFLKRRKMPKGYLVIKFVFAPAHADDNQQTMKDW